MASATIANNTDDLLDKIIINSTHFNEINDIKDVNLEELEKKQNKRVVEILSEVLSRIGTINGPYILEKSLLNIRSNRESGNRNINYIVSLFNQAIKNEVQKKQNPFQDGKPEIKRILEEADYLEKPKVELEGLEKQREIFWNPKGSPVPRQMTEDWAKLMQSLALIIAGILYVHDENSTVRATARVGIAANIAYIVMKIIAAVVFTYSAGTIYRNENK